MIQDQALIPQEPPTREQIMGVRHTRAQLAAWGVSWPPPKGWLRRLLGEADERAGVATKAGRLVIGEPHPAWPEWVYEGDGSFGASVPR